MQHIRYYAGWKDLKAFAKEEVQLDSSAMIRLLEGRTTMHADTIEAWSARLVELATAKGLSPELIEASRNLRSPSTMPPNAGIYGYWNNVYRWPDHRETPGSYETDFAVPFARGEYLAAWAALNPSLCVCRAPMSHLTTRARNAIRAGVWDGCRRFGHHPEDVVLDAWRRLARERNHGFPQFARTPDYLVATAGAGHSGPGARILELITSRSSRLVGTGQTMKHMRLIARTSALENALDTSPRKVRFTYVVDHVRPYAGIAPDNCGKHPDGGPSGCIKE